jgi:hypothetical protein
MKFVMCSANKQQQRLYDMYDVIIVLLFILYTGLENLFNRWELQNLQISLITSRMFFVL